MFCDYLLQKEQVTIREVARLLGMFASCFLAVFLAEMISDASSLGWGAFDNGIATGGQFTEE